MHKVGAVILASGVSSRMGSPKLLLSLKGKPILRWVMEAACQSKISPILVVAGELFERYQELGRDLPEITFLKNENYKEGMSTSLALGVSALSSETEALLVFLADQPLIPPGVIEELVGVYQGHREKDSLLEGSLENSGTEVSSGNPVIEGFFEDPLIQNPLIVRPRYGDTVGHPVLFDRSLYPELKRVKGDQGGRDVIRSHQDQLQIVSFPNEEWGWDIDTPMDWERIKRENPTLNEENPVLNREIGRLYRFCKRERS